MRLRTVLVTWAAALVGAGALAGSAVAGGIVEWRIPDGRTGFSDRDRVPPGAVIVDERQRNRPEICDLLQRKPDIARARLKGQAVVAADHRRNPRVAVCARDLIWIAERFAEEACAASDFEQVESRAVAAAVNDCRDRFATR